jgi:hypothetical protein
MKILIFLKFLFFIYLVSFKHINSNPNTSSNTNTNIEEDNESYNNMDIIEKDRILACSELLKKKMINEEVNIKY